MHLTPTEFAPSGCEISKLSKGFFFSLVLAFLYLVWKVLKSVKLEYMRPLIPTRNQRLFFFLEWRYVREFRGNLFLVDEDVVGLPVQKRGVGFMFQSFALFKHMTVGENIAFGPRIQKQNVDLEKRYLITSIPVPKPSIHVCYSRVYIYVLCVNR